MPTPSLETELFMMNADDSSLLSRQDKALNSQNVTGAGMDVDMGMFGDQFLGGAEVVASNDPLLLATNDDLNTVAMQQHLSFLTEPSLDIDMSGASDQLMVGLNLDLSVNAPSIEDIDLLDSFNTQTSASSASPSADSESNDGDSSDHQDSLPTSPTDQGLTTAVDLAPVDRKAKRRQQVAISARRHRCRKKHEMINLRKEVTHLTSQLELLRLRHKVMRQSGEVAAWEERAMAQRRKRRQSEQMNEALRRAIFIQSGFLQDLKSAFSSAPIFNMEMNLRELLHTYTHLGKNVRSRQRDYESVCSNSKIEMALDIVRRETKDIPFRTPFIRAEQLRGTDSIRGTNHVSVYSFDHTNLPKVFYAAIEATKKGGNAWPEYQHIDSIDHTIDQPAENIHYGASTIHYRRQDRPDEMVVVESRAINYHRLTESYAVLIWDYVDQDELFPVSNQTHIRRDNIGVLLISVEMCDDNKRRIVCRCVCTKMHALNVPSPASERFTICTDKGERSCGSAVYQCMREELGKDNQTTSA